MATMGRAVILTIFYPGWTSTHPEDHSGDISLQSDCNFQSLTFHGYHDNGGHFIVNPQLLRPFKNIPKGAPVQIVNLELDTYVHHRTVPNYKIIGSMVSDNRWWEPHMLQKEIIIIILLRKEAKTISPETLLGRFN